MKIVDLPTAIYETKRAVYEASGIEPDTIDLPLKLYYELVFTLRELYDFRELNLDSWEGLKINLLWQNSDQFIIRKESNTYVSSN